MTRKYPRLIELGRECANRLFRRGGPPDPDETRELQEFDAFMKADMALGLAAESICQTRDELIAYSRDKQLVPWLRPFLERRGWIDADWDRRLDHLGREFRRRAH